MRKRVVVAAMAVLIWLVAPVGVPADAETPKLVRVAYSEFAPYSATAMDGRIEGISIDSLRLLLERKGYVIEFVPARNPAGMLEMLRHGKVDMTTLLAINDRRAEVGDFTTPVTETSVSIYVADTTPVPVSVADIAGMRIGVTPGSVSDILVSETSGARPVHLETFEAVILALLRGEIEGLAAPNGVLWSQAARAGLTDRLHAGPALKRAEVGFLVSRDAPALRAELDAAIGQAALHGALRAIEQDWLQAPTDNTEPWRGLALALVALLILAAAGGLMFHLRRLAAAAREAALLSQVLCESDVAVAALGPDGEPRLLTPTNNANATRRAARAQGDMPGHSPESATGQPKASAPRNWLRRVVTMEGGRTFAVVADISDERVDAAPLQSAYEAVKTENERLSGFTSMVAHDLKAPLRNVGMILDWVVEDFEAMGADLPDTITEKVDMAQTLVERQTRLISDLLNYARSQDNRERVAFDPMPRLEGILALVALPPGFSVVVTNRLPGLLANPVAFDTVLRNLVSNAARHHDHAIGRIEITGTVHGDMAEIRVIDDGPGVPEDVRKRIFDAFYRHSAGQDDAGFGLGLALVAKEVDGWGGVVECRSRRDGARGSEFVITVPRSEVVTASSGAQPADAKTMSDEADNTVEATDRSAQPVMTFPAPLDPTGAASTAKPEGIRPS